MYKESFHNSVNYTGEKKERAEKKALSQDLLVLELLRDNPNKEFTPPEVHKSIEALHNSPLTSIRRALTNLVNKSKGGEIVGGEIIKTSETKKGLFGHDNHKWVYIPKIKEYQPKLFNV